LTRKLKQNVKIWRLSSIEVSFSYSKAKFKVGDEVLIKNHNNYNNMFYRWRSSNSNIIENLIDMLH